MGEAVVADTFAARDAAAEGSDEIPCSMLKASLG